MAFLESVRGARFFDGQLPQLIKHLGALSTDQLPKLTKAIDGVTAALRGPVQCQLLPDGAEPDENLLRDLYLGFYEPADEAAASSSPKYQELTAQLKAAEENLRKQLSPGPMEAVNAYTQLLVDRGCVENGMVFGAGFKCATKLIAAGLAGKRGQAS